MERCRGTPGARSQSGWAGQEVQEQGETSARLHHAEVWGGALAPRRDRPGGTRADTLAVSATKRSRPL